jgi:GT2 family glycosyltransferase
MKIALVVAAYNSPKIVELFASATGGSHELEFRVFLHSKHPKVLEATGRIASSAGVICYPYHVNRGLSKSWNDGILASYDDGADVVLVANDDVMFSSGDALKIAEKALRHRNRYLVTAAGFHDYFARRVASHGYSCFAINPIALETIGCFDENFFPGYCEDQDYAYRARIAGLSEENCPDTMVHHAGSQTIRIDPELHRQNRLTQSRNLEYYRRKWGGHGDQEQYFHPFNNPDLRPYIAPADRHSPYGPLYDRADHEIVRL